MDLSKLKENESMAQHSTFRAGGNAKFFYELDNLDEIPSVIKWATDNKTPYLVLGGGSNVLFMDSGYDGLVIKITANQIKIDESEIIADAGARIALVSKFAEKNDLGGVEEFISLPGTVGGAIYGNAGCFWKEISDVLTRGWIFRDGEIVEVPNEYFDFKYRWSKLKDTQEVLLKAAFAVEKGCFPERMKEVMEKRQEKQPWGMTAGSFFKNPGPTPEMSAGYLIDKCGLKGEMVGGAEISSKHANFILNTGTATATDILELADIAKKAVKGQFNIELKPEVQIIG